MPEHLRALIVVLVLSSVVFHVTRRAAVALILPSTFARWRNSFLILTAVLFLAHNYWLYVLATIVLAMILLKQEKHLVALFFVLAFAAPPLRIEIPGFGLVNYLFAIDHYRLLTIVMLGPVAIGLLQQSSTLKFGRSSVDWMVMGFFLVVCALQTRDATVTSWLRAVLSTMIDILVPYYVVSRSLRDLNDFKHAFLGFVLGAMVLSVVGMFEAVRVWRLYEAVSGQLVQNAAGFAGYLMRGGLLRPTASLGSAIVLGYVIMVGFGYFLFLCQTKMSQKQVWAGLLVLGAGVLGALSRGPWVGLAFLILVYVLLGPSPVKHLFKLGLVSLLVLGIATVVPQGQVLLDLLPFVGEEESFNVEYRANLLTAALPVIERNLWIGSTDYLSAPELQVMIQGQGIIDIVNSYIGVTLDYGVLGLFFFVGMWLATLKVLRSSMRQSKSLEPDYQQLGRALFATIASIMLVIYTVSGISAIPLVYWTAVGCCVAYEALVKRVHSQAMVNA